ncbi:hypothetical protein BDQ17DRAFT_1332243 [Cyathus striatus]|nr:hypothetical protein BDQ17DRAFT_1332243 [Cyathus striatus]
MSFLFPPEIEDEIFQHVFYGDNASPGHIDEHKFEIALKSKPKTFFQRNVKNVLFAFAVSMEFATSLLSICTGIQHLFIETTIDKLFAQNIATLPLLRSLDTNLYTLDTFDIFKLGLSQVSYLSLGGLVFYKDVDYNYLEMFRSLPALTHLVIFVDISIKYLPKTLRSLSDIEKLQSIVIMLNHDVVPELINEWEEVDTRVMVACLKSGSCITHWEERMDYGGSIDFEEGFRYGGDRWSSEDEDSDNNDDMDLGGNANEVRNILD